MYIITYWITTTQSNKNDENYLLEIIMNNKEIIDCVTKLMYNRLLYKSGKTSMYSKKREMIMCIERWYRDSMIVSTDNKRKRDLDERYDTDDE